MSRSFEGNFSKLNKFAKGFATTTGLVVRVGIFGEKNSRNDGMTNAELGAIHEFGVMSKNIPPRSFLRMPIAFKQNDILKKTSAGAPALLAQGRLIQILENLGRACMEVVIGAFRSSGYGNWPKDKPRTAAHKLTSKGKKATAKNIAKDLPLVDTGQLQRSILWKVGPR